jgi:protein-S-isoprenylcysteine O-methyltransferase Ste14
MPSERIAEIVFYAVIACWIGFAMVFALRKRPEKKPETTRDRAAGAGIFLQGLGYFTVWFWTRQRSGFRPLASMTRPCEIALAVFTVALAAGSVWLVMSAVRTLGRQWAVAARLVEGHKLISDGPYQWVRNPIYTGMFGMLLATGLGVSRWIVIPPAILVFAVGMTIRIRSEEKLLRAAFGEEFEAYARRVPAVLPGIY